MSQLSTSTFRSLLNNTFTQKRIEYVSDGMGGSTETETTVGTFEGRLRPLQPQEMEFAARMGTQFSHVLYCEPREFQKDDVIEFRVERYRIIDVQEPGYADFHLQVWLRREV